MQTVLGRALRVGNKWTGKEIPLRRNVWGGGGKEPAPFPAPASPAALIDVPCITAALGPGGRRPLRRSPLLEQGQQPDVPGLWGPGMGAGKAGSGPGGSRPEVELLPPSLWQLDSGGFGSALNFGQWPRLPGT